ncbi:MAG TPA: response regulator transcription factor [Candidatus Acidoferrum sp.]|nr:response regulator transcription factor [Candidatus Acidoferrum sp.]
MRVLIVEDDRRMAELLQKGLEEENHVVSVAHNGAEGLEMTQSYQFDVLVLDWMLPRMDGLEVARRVRKSGRSTPILMLTARDAVPDIVKGLDAGADDYLTKPFSFAEFLARLRALARRPAAAHDNRLQIADLALDLRTHQVFRGKQEIHLTQTEYRLLEFLMRRSGAVASRRAIIEAVWGLDAEVEENTLDAFVRLLRTKIDSGQKQKVIHTVRGFGYCARSENRAENRSGVKD